jgi:LuxR family transcriptional regulator, quorum-sensing system regulator BjaR1
MLQTILPLAQDALAAPDLGVAADHFHRALRAHDVTYLQARAYHRPLGTLTSDRHWQAGGFVARHAKPGWVDSAAFKHVCFDQNPLVDAIASSLTRYRFSDFSPHGCRQSKPYWDAMGEADMAEALCATAYGSGRRITSFHIGFDRREFAPGEADAIQIAALMIAEAFLPTVAASDLVAPALTRRERDVMAYVAEGKTDWEIGVILSLSETTARFHADNARRKLGAVNRAHAVARYLALRA